MQSIDIDFEVYKRLTLLRDNEETTYNDVIRKLLDIPVIKEEDTPIQNQEFLPWVTRGYPFPHGTQFRAKYKGTMYFAEVNNGRLILNGKSFDSPSRAAISITNNSVNGWMFWECKLPNQSFWNAISSLRSGQ